MRLPSGSDLHRRLAFPALAAVVVSLAPTLPAQQLTEQVDVRVVQVPVVVWRGDEPVRGLTKEDFDVFVNGERQQIDYFDVVEFDGLSEAPPAQAEPAVERVAPRRDQRRLTVLVFDVRNSSYQSIRQALPHARKIVESAAPEDVFSVAVFNGAPYVKYAVPFTADRSAVARAVSTLRPGGAGDPLALTVTGDERASVGLVVEPPSSTIGVEGGYTNEVITGMETTEDAIEVLSGVRIPSATGAVRQDEEWLGDMNARSWAYALAAVADDLAPLEGIKQVTLFSEGIRFERAGLSANVPEMQRLHRHFRKAGAVLDIIDVGGLRAPGGQAGTGGFSAAYDTSEIAPDRGAPQGMFAAANGTGGRVIHGTGVENAVRIFADTRSVTYMLGLRPVAGERENNEIVVRLKDRSLSTRLSYRRGYSTLREKRQGMSRMELADTLLNDVPQDDVTVKLYADHRGTVDVGMPSNELLAHAMRGLVTLDVILYLYNEANEVVGWKWRKMRLDERSTRDLLKGAELVRRERFSLLPGRYTAKAIVHVEERDLVGYRRLDFEVTETVSHADREADPSGSRKVRANDPQR